ncbi:MAG: tRNA (adenine-N1)-methyltransferase [Actinobacteria bacterium]|nr:tRNA (adenine-N1)-methyltransferase [Actinomycetota bacterium]NBY14759.1 tRNA (adenine-N1)-methyltransferase [Actinomycetota bacterium]
MTSQKALFAIGDRVQLTDTKGRKHTVVLEAGREFHTNHGAIAHDELIGKPEGITVTSTGNYVYLALRPLLSDFVLSMPRGAAVIYPKDAAAIVGLADIYPGSSVVEAGVGSGALSCSLLRAIGETGQLHSYERREEFAKVAEKNVSTFFGTRPSNWNLTLGSVQDETSALADESVDRVILDMLSPWECVRAVSRITRPGGVFVIYVATTTQMAKTIEAIRDSKSWTDPVGQELIARTWHVEGLAVRPSHKMQGHTGFLVVARKLAAGTVLPPRRIRPAKGFDAQELEQEQDE